MKPFSLVYLFPFLLLNPILLLQRFKPTAVQFSGFVVVPSTAVGYSTVSTGPSHPRYYKGLRRRAAFVVHGTIHGGLFEVLKCPTCKSPREADDRELQSSQESGIESDLVVSSKTSIVGYQPSTSQTSHLWDVHRPRRTSYRYRLISMDLEPQHRIASAVYLYLSVPSNNLVNLTFLALRYGSATPASHPLLTKRDPSFFRSLGMSLDFSTFLPGAQRGKRREHGVEGMGRHLSSSVHSTVGRHSTRP